MPRSRTRKWTIYLPRFSCPHCNRGLDNIRFEGRLHLPHNPRKRASRAPKRGGYIDRSKGGESEAEEEVD